MERTYQKTIDLTLYLYDTEGRDFSLKLGSG